MKSSNNVKLASVSNELATQTYKDHKKVIDYVTRKHKGREYYDDLRQYVLIRIMENLIDHDPTKSKLSTWVQRMAEQAVYRFVETPTRNMGYHGTGFSRALRGEKPAVIYRGVSSMTNDEGDEISPFDILPTDEMNPEEAAITADMLKAINLVLSAYPKGKDKAAQLTVDCFADDVATRKAVAEKHGINYRTFDYHLVQIKKQIVQATR